MPNALTRGAVINIHLTVGASVARAAGTAITAQRIGASAPVPTRVLVTFIYVNVALLPCGDRKNKVSNYIPKVLFHISI